MLAQSVLQVAEIRTELGTQPKFWSLCFEGEKI